MKPFRRTHFVRVAAAALAAPAIVRAPARAATFDYKLGHTNPVEHPVHVRLIEWSNAIKAETGGQVNVTIFPNGALGSQSSMINQIRVGAIQFFLNLSSVFTVIVPVAAIDSIGFVFKGPQEPWALMDGPLGTYVRKEFESRHLYAFERPWDNGMRQITTSTKPIRSLADFANFKIRTPQAKISVDLFSSLGASPTPLDSSETYSSLQTHLVDGEEAPLANIESQHFYEVQKYLSMTNHQWAGHWLTANVEAWNALSPALRAIVERNATKYALFERRDMVRFNAASGDKLRRQGLIFNLPETESMRAKLRPYYARWKAELGTTAWDLLEAKVGKLA